MKTLHLLALAAVAIDGVYRVWRMTMCTEYNNTEYDISHFVSYHTAG